MNEIKKVVDNWRNISSSDYIASIDVESIVKNNGRCVLTIKSAEQRLAKDDQHLSPKQQFRCNGNRGDFNIIHFVEDVKSMIVNVGNSQVLWRFVDTGQAADESVQKWAGLCIEIVVDKSIEFAGNKGGMVILNQLPIVAKPELSPDSPTWDGFKDKVKDRIEEEGEQALDIEAAKEIVRHNLSKHYSISDKNWELLCAG